MGLDAAHIKINLDQCGFPEDRLGYGYKFVVTNFTFSPIKKQKYNLKRFLNILFPYAETLIQGREGPGGSLAY